MRAKYSGKIYNNRILIVAGGSSLSAATNIDKLLQICVKLRDIYLITYCKKSLIVYGHADCSFELKPSFNNILSFFKTQLQISKVIIFNREARNCSTIFFVFGNDLQIVPIIIAKLLKKIVIIRSDGRPTIVMKKYLKSQSIIKKIIFKFIEEINYNLADILLSECEYMIADHENCE